MKYFYLEYSTTWRLNIDVTWGVRSPGVPNPQPSEGKPGKALWARPQSEAGRRRWRSGGKVPRKPREGGSLGVQPLGPPHAMGKPCGLPKFICWKTRQVDMDGPIRCSSLTLEREEHLKVKHKKMLCGSSGGWWAASAAKIPAQCSWYPYTMQLKSLHNVAEIHTQCSWNPYRM
jgi:hypothetical protein